MGIVYNNTLKTGLVYNGVEYLTDATEPHVQYEYSFNIKQTVTPSANTENTSGYVVTFNFVTEPFRLYKNDDILTPLNYLPSYKFVLNNVTQQQISGLTLNYNNDNTFSITGSLNIETVYSTTKNGTASDVGIALLDDNDNLFVSDIQLFSNTTASSSTTVTFTNSTMTYTSESRRLVIKENISLPYTIPSYSTPTKYVTSSTSSAISFTVASRKIY